MHSCGRNGNLTESGGIGIHQPHWNLRPRGKGGARDSEAFAKRAPRGILGSRLAGKDMPQSLGKLYVHLVFSTKGRERVLQEETAGDLHIYMGGCLKGMKCIPVEINTEPDHAHVLFLLGRTVNLSEVVGGVKKSATEWLRKQSGQYSDFHWQSGYGAFSVSQSGVGEVRAYIRNQREHHRVRTFQDEFRILLTKYQIDFDERYVWD